MAFIHVIIVLWGFRLMASPMFICLFIAAQAIFQLSGVCHNYQWQGCQFRPMLGTLGLWAGRDLYRATATATRGIGLYGLIRKTGTHESNLQLQTVIGPNVVDVDIFIPTIWPILTCWFRWRITPHSWAIYWAHGGCDRSTGNTYSF
jgi:hypothetical protein